MKKAALEKIDFSKTDRDLYTATPKAKEVTAGKATFLSFEGKGEPGGKAFEDAIQQLYSLAYTAKFMLRHNGKLDFAVGKLECLWHTENIEQTPRSEWCWQMLVRIPDTVTAADLKKARDEVRRKRGLDTSGVKRWTWKEGRCVQMMHVGPYDQVGRSYSQLDEYARERGLVASCPAHEIYISNPQRVEPARLKTIIRLPVSSPAP
ncbi:MAG: GyrI-like domain-containing protein [Acidobacteria bacterium]|nr:GyrI-like domain-containing protein [Acidobacteriota bacterium]